ncbi:MAG: SH3 domain-containing protein, partial [Clostridia bacterium]|nr:SH3 domain-containing protein [Clostridia bacterium]
MKKALSILCMAGILLLLAGTALGESLYVDNRETDKIYPERLNLRSEPSRSGGILGLYYTGTEVNVVSEDSDGYTKVDIGGVTGYMASEYLITLDEAHERYGAESGFGDGREAEIDLSGMWMSSVPLLPLTDPDSTALGALSTGDGVGLLGIVDDWAYVTADVDGERKLGYVPLDTLTDVGGRKVLIVAGKKADSQTNLYDEPTTRAQPI